MKKTVYSLVIVSLVFAGAQVIANNAPATKTLTVKLKTQDGQVIRCDVHPRDVNMIKTWKKGSSIMMYFPGGVKLPAEKGYGW